MLSNLWLQMMLLLDFHSFYVQVVRERKHNHKCLGDVLAQVHQPPLPYSSRKCII